MARVPTYDNFQVQPNTIDGRFGIPEIPDNVGSGKTTERIYVSEIPLAERARIIEARRGEGLPVTEQAIAEYWVNRGKPKGQQ